MKKILPSIIVITLLLAYVTGGYICVHTPENQRIGFISFFNAEVFRSLADENFLMFYIKSIVIGMSRALIAPVALLLYFHLKKPKV